MGKWMSGDQVQLAMILMSLDHYHLSVATGSFLAMSSSLGEARIVVHYHSGNPHHYSVQHRPVGGEWVHYDVVGDGACGRRALDLIKVLLSGEHVYFGRDLSDHGWKEPLVKEPELVLNEAFDVGGDVTYVWAVKHDDLALAHQLQLQKAGGGGLPRPVQEAVGANAPGTRAPAPAGGGGRAPAAPADGGRAPAAPASAPPADVERLVAKTAKDAKDAQVASDGHYANYISLCEGNAQAEPVAAALQQWQEAAKAAKAAQVAADEAIAQAARAAQVANDAAIAAALAI